MRSILFLVNIIVCKHWTLRRHKYPTMQCSADNNSNITDTCCQPLRLKSVGATLVAYLFQKFDDYLAMKMPAVRICYCVASYWMHISDVLLLLLLLSAVLKEYYCRLPVELRLARVTEVTRLQSNGERLSGNASLPR